jgi:hypothetical protein
MHAGIGKLCNCGVANWDLDLERGKGNEHL